MPTTVLAKTGQLVVSMTARLPRTNNQPVTMIQLQIGLPARIALQVGEVAPVRLVVQTYDL